MNKRLVVGGVVVAVFLTGVFVLSAQSGFRAMMVALLGVMLAGYLWRQSRAAGVLCMGVAYYAILWASLWNAVLGSFLVTPVLKILDACVLLWVVWQHD
ncbi:hypothetical protein HY490_04100 [Candidatus Woesearchaeota archaeon]|nr:hypothetical protein [Candidatus Woesearchaeota archaeon]